MVYSIRLRYRFWLASYFMYLATYVCTVKLNLIVGCHRTNCQIVFFLPHMLVFGVTHHTFIHSCCCLISYIAGINFMSRYIYIYIFGWDSSLIDPSPTGFFQYITFTEISTTWSFLILCRYSTSTSTSIYK